MKPPKNLYDTGFVMRLFDEMSKTYGVVNFLSSFGFTARWRRQCVEALPSRPGAVVLDLMTGQGELLHLLEPKVGESGKITALDISPRMCEAAQKHARGRRCSVSVIEEDFLQNSLPDQCADLIVSSFGLKTFSPDQLVVVVEQTARLLRRGGSFSFLEISVPQSLWLRWAYFVYLKGFIPWIGALFLGNPANYKMLGVYTEQFGSCQSLVPIFKQCGLDVEYRSYFFGCASGMVGHKK